MVTAQFEDIYGYRRVKGKRNWKIKMSSLRVHIIMSSLHIEECVLFKNEKKHIFLCKEYSPLEVYVKNILPWKLSLTYSQTRVVTVTAHAKTGCWMSVKILTVWPKNNLAKLFMVWLESNYLNLTIVNTFCIMHIH